MKANCSCTLIEGPKLIIVDTMTAWDRELIVKALQDRRGTCVHRGDIFNTEVITSEGYQLCGGVRVVATPGHTSEDVTVLVETESDGTRSTYAITGDLFEKEEDILNPSIWQELGAPELQKMQSQMRSRIINLADVIVPGHGPQFQVTDALRNIVNNQVIT
ncbi:hypothetical protein KM043_007762 [Ampulex compressa]|nr:hypothetical protein KM043_007762 [Ampulex compressa]